MRRLSTEGIWPERRTEDRTSTEKTMEIRRIKKYAAAALITAGMLLLMPVRLRAEVAGKVYGTDRIPEERISIYAETPLGIRAKVDTESCSIRDYYYGEADVLDFSFLYLRGKKRIVTVPVKEVSARYTPPVYPGDRFTPLGLRCTTLYADGKVDETYPLSVKNAPDRFLNVGERITVATKDGMAQVLIDPVSIVSIETNQEEDIYQYDSPQFSAIRFYYADGNERVVSKDDVEFSTDPDAPLEKIGEQALVFTYKGIPYRLSLTAKENTNVTNAVRENREEIREADYIYISDTLFITVTRHTDSLGCYFISHVVINSPEQFVSALSYDTWGGKREKPSSAADRLGMVLAANGSYFSYDTNTPRCADVFIKHGQVYSDPDEVTDGQELCLMQDGRLWTPPEGLTASALLEEGVTDIWGAGDPLLIQDGKLYPTEHQWVNGKYPRTGIGMVKPCEYYLLTAGSGGYKGGLTFDDVQRIFKDLGCSYARTLDGGGSSTLVFNDGSGVSVVNNPAGKVERPVPDVIGFCN